MGALGTLLGFALTLYMLVLIARMVLDWVGMVGTSPPWTRRARGLAYAATEPVIGPVRRVVRPVRLGGISLDLAFTLVFVAVLVLRSIAFSL
ncbi:MULTISPECIES: YggT family protein [unclassified Amycolatopsis]|jgi:YggT family protein|uniref:YggT family protein n=1 Tax=unclassified Amycolatopsis TaxID=2618356 RepID=UPI002E0FD7FB|nr:MULTISPECIES: YggT family protein [unclassified Amycolatopsis]WSJ73738.1 YggT family protein [Amycolatopsis sp. NBC_01307]WSK82600.1 YggT family protein [Amycolatopsis sp. NBC_01286]